MSPAPVRSRRSRTISDVIVMFFERRAEASIQTTPRACPGDRGASGRPRGARRAPRLARLFFGDLRDVAGDTEGGALAVFVRVEERRGFSARRDPCGHPLGEALAARRTRFVAGRDRLV